MERQATCTETEYKDAIRSSLSFTPRFSSLAGWLVEEVFVMSQDWTTVADPHKYADAQTIAWLRHRVTDYDSDSDDSEYLDNLFEVGPEAEEHAETCAACQAGVNYCSEYDRIVASEIVEANMQRRAAKREYNDEARSVLYHHTARGSHPDDCPLCALWTRQARSPSDQAHTPK